jgi:predicted small metal-binding protein
MKSLTCRELGGKCDQKLSANSWDEMVKLMTKHVMEKHPDVAKTMEKMHNEDPQKWGKQMNPNGKRPPSSNPGRFQGMGRRRQGSFRQPGKE